MSDEEDSKVVNVEVHPLDDLIKEKAIPEDDIIVVRMDVEGYEERVFEGMKNLLCSSRPVYIHAELHPDLGVSIRDIVNLLESNAFKPEFVSFNGGNSMREISSFDEIVGVDVNAHIMAGRF